MSQAREARRKERRRNQSPEVKALRNAIRNGRYPRYFLAKEPGSDTLLERQKIKQRGRTRRKLTWRLLSTFHALMSLPEVKPNVPSEDQPQNPPSAPQSA